MKYQGSKTRIVKDILKIMLSVRGDRVWVEPFVGGGNMIDKVTGKRIGADINKWAIEALTIIRDRVEDLPKNNTEFTKDDYEKIRQGAEHEFKAIAGFCYSFGSKWLDTWAKGKGRDFVKETYSSLNKQKPLLQGVELICCAYNELKIPENSLIYCDPPYKNTRKYNKVQSFNHSEFWQWAEEQAKNHIVFVSELTAPENWVEVWSKNIIYTTARLGKNNPTKTEKLFIHESQAHLIKSNTLFDEARKHATNKTNSH